MLILIILLLGFYYGYVNGQFGSASVVSTMISSRAARPRFALILAAVGMSVGTLVFGSEVAVTITQNLISREALDSTLVPAALCGAILWSSTAMYFKVPVSTTQALVGGLLGAVWMGHGQSAILSGGILKVAAGLFLSPIVGMFCGYLFVRFFYWVGQWMSPRMNIWLQRGQIIASLMMSLVFGSNNAQQLMGIIVLGLYANGWITVLEVPRWVMLFSAASIAIGAISGGWRIIHTIGNRFYKIRPIHGFGAQVSSASVIFTSLVVGAPISASQVVTSAVVGAGSADRLQKVRWQVVQNILISWFLTIPCAALSSAFVYWLITR